MAMSAQEKQEFANAVANGINSIVTNAMQEFDADGIKALTETETAFETANAAEAAARSVLTTAMLAATDDGKALRLQYIGDDAMRDAIDAAIDADPNTVWPIAFGYAGFMGCVDASGGDDFAALASEKAKVAAQLKGLQDTSADKLRFVPAVLTALAERAVAVMEIPAESAGVFTLTLAAEGKVDVVSGGKAAASGTSSAQPPTGAPDKIGYVFVNAPDDVYSVTKAEVSNAADRIKRVLNATGIAKHANPNVTSNPGRGDLHKSQIFTQVYPLAYSLFPENTLLTQALQRLEIWSGGTDGYANTLTVYEYVPDNVETDADGGKMRVAMECIIADKRTEKGYQRGTQNSARFVQVSAYKVDADGTHHPDENKPTLRFAPGGCLYSDKPLANVAGAE